MGHWSHTAKGPATAAGYNLHSARSVVITDYIGPGPKAIHEPFAFIPDYDFQESSVAELYHRSGRRSVYLGDWHSHPGGKTDLSRTDKKSLRRIAQSLKARCPNPLMLITDDDESPGFSIWCQMGASTLHWLASRHPIKLFPHFFDVLDQNQEPGPR